MKLIIIAILAVLIAPSIAIECSAAYNTYLMKKVYRKLSRNGHRISANKDCRYCRTEQALGGGTYYKR